MPFKSSLRGLRALLALWLIFTAPIVGAADYITARAYLEDKAGTLTQTQAQQSQAWTPYAGVLSKGYSSHVLWLRLHIDPFAVQPDTLSPASLGDDALILRIRPTVLDEVALFDPLQPSDTLRRAGDTYPWDSSEYPSLHLNFVIPRGEVARDIWLRIHTDSTQVVVVDALSLRALQASDRRIELIYSLLLALLLLFMLWSLVNWLTHKERVIGVSVIKQLTGIAFTLAGVGYLRVFLSDVLSPAQLNQWTHALVLAYTASVAWFDYHLLREYAPPRWGMRLLQLCIWLLPFELALLLLSQERAALSLNMWVVLLEPVLGLFLILRAGSTTAAFTDSEGAPSTATAPVVSRKVLIILFGSLVAVFSSLALVALGLFQAGNFLLYAFLMHGLISGMVMTGVLQVRARRLEARRQATVADLALAKQSAQQERQQRMEQGRFLSMLAHELKTPLSVIRLVLSAPTPAPALVIHADSAARDMNQVIERCLQVERLADGQLVLQRTAVDLCEELRQLNIQSVRPERLQLVMPPALLVHTDANLLRVVLGNLLDNALKYSPPHSEITILIALNACGKRDGAQISIQNLPRMAGWPDATQVFQKYYRSPSAHHQTGSGLGLYLVHSMAQLLGGELRYAPTTTHINFTLWLPA